MKMKMGARGVVLVMFMILVGLRACEVDANKLSGRKTLYRVVQSRTGAHAHVRVRAHAHVQAQAQAQAQAHAHAHVHVHDLTTNKAQGELKAASNVGDSMKIVNELCATATYKDACIKSLGSLSQTSGNDPRQYFKNGLKLALDEVTKASNLPKTLVPKASTSRANSALESCTDLLEQSMDRLKMASDQLMSGDLSVTLKDPQTIFNLRLELGDVNTFSTNCLDEFGEAEAPELQKTMQEGVESAKELAVNMLDIVSTYIF